MQSFAQSFAHPPGEKAIDFHDSSVDVCIEPAAKSIYMEYLSRRKYTHYKRFCKTLTLEDDPELIEDYKKAHAAGTAWPEITQGMIDVGILDMEIYLAGSQLFMIMDTVPDFDHERMMAELATKPRQSEWETYMSKFQRTPEEASATEKWLVLERIYKLGD